MEKKLIYLDNAAAAQPCQETADLFSAMIMHAFVNQEAAHGLAYNLKQEIAEAEKILSQSLTGDDGVSILWGGSGTTLISALLQLPVFKRGNIVTTELEHPALSAAIQRSGAEPRTVKTPGGRIALKHLEELLDTKTVLVAVHHVQSETGIIQDLSHMREIIEAKAPNAMFMADTIQSAGKIPVPWHDAKLDFAVVSGHKLGVPGGSALLYRNRKYNGQADFTAFFKQLRHSEYLLGRPDPAAILTLAHTVKQNIERLHENYAAILKLNMRLRNGLSKISLPQGKIIFTASPDNASPYIIHFIIPGFQGAVLVRMLSEENIFTASGSACSAESSTPGKTLPAMGFKRSEAYSALRVSLWHSNSESDIDIFISALDKVLRNY